MIKLNKYLILSLLICVSACCGAQTSSQSESSKSSHFSSSSIYSSASSIQKSEHSSITSSHSSSSEISSSEIGCQHDPKLIKGREATCTQTGLTDGYICSKCGKLLEAQQRIDKKPHNYALSSINVGENKIIRQSAYKCVDCGHSSKASLSTTDINNVPILEINGDISEISKQNEVDVSVNYIDNNHPFESFAKIKYQGSSSLAFDKKNFNITFYNEKGKKNKILIKDEWGKQNKYTLKANWVDFSQSRNVTSGKIFSSIVHSRNIDDDLSKLNNGGVVDGFPIIIYINNLYQGLYTLNIPKNKWMFGMDGEDVNQALLMGSSFNESIYLNEPVAYDFSNGWELEYCSTEDTTGTKWVADSMNSLISFLNESSDEPFKAWLQNYCLVERTIDSMLFSNFICAGDNFAKNILWATFDGIKWYPSLYDLDGTWGMMYNGLQYYSSKTFLPDEIVKQNNCNLLWKRLYKCFMPEIKARYFELRESILTEDYLGSYFDNFFQSIPDILRSTEIEKWPNSVAPSLNTITQIKTFIKERIVNYDNYFNKQ